MVVHLGAVHGADLDKFVISIGSCHRSVVETMETIKETLLSRFSTEAKDGNFPLVVHFDGKQLNQDFGGRRETLSREVLVLTSPYLERTRCQAGSGQDLQSQVGKGLPGDAPHSPGPLTPLCRHIAMHIQQEPALDCLGGNRGHGLGKSSTFWQ